MLLARQQQQKLIAMIWRNNEFTIIEQQLIYTNHQNKVKSYYDRGLKNDKNGEVIQGISITFI